MNNDIWQLILAILLIAVCGISAIQRNTLIEQKKEIALQGAELKELKEHLAVNKEDMLVLKQQAKSAKMLLASKQSLCKK